MTCTVFTNGCFDGGLHAGHVNLLVKCRSLAGRHGKVVVAIDADLKIRADKGPTRPIFSYKEREQHLKSLTYPDDSLIIPLIDDVIFFDTNENLYELIKRVQPKFIVKGSDWNGNVVGSDLSEVILFDLHPKVSLTKLEKRLNVMKLLEEIDCTVGSA